MNTVEKINSRSSACEISRAIQNGKCSSSEIISQCLENVSSSNDKLNCFTSVLNERAQIRAREIDHKIAQGKQTGPLTGVPFSVKNLFDIKGISTLAGSKINRDHSPATEDAVLIKRLEAAGAILVGGVAMGEYAYDFTGENEHYGHCKNPWDLSRMSGGSSSGSGTSVASGVVPFSLGSDTNGSIRVPSSLCGIFGLKPTYGRVPRTGTFPFCDSLDHLGPLARTVEDLAQVYDQIQGMDSGDPACADRKVQSVSEKIERDISELTVAKAGGYFDCTDFPQAGAAVDLVCRALGASMELPMKGTKYGRAAAYLITNAESSTLHKSRLQTRVEDFDEDTRCRFLAGAMLPANWYIQAQAARRWWLEQMLEMFQTCDLIIAPATPCPAPKNGEKYLNIGGEQHLLRPNLGLFTQPFSAIGLPVVCVPVWTDDSDLPIGVQIVAAPWREDLAFQAANYLEKTGLCKVRMPPPI